jgi:hypothetical protein
MAPVSNPVSNLPKYQPVHCAKTLEYYITREAFHSVCLHFRHLGRNVNKLLNNFFTMIPAF